MTDYAIISLGGKQYVVREGETLVVDRLDSEEGKTFQPDVLFLGGNGEGELAPSTTVTAKVVGHERGPKVRIGKYRPKKGYKRHTGFRSSLTRIEITGIGSGARKKAAAPKAEAARQAEAAPKAEAAPAPQAEAAPKAEAAAEAPARHAHPPKGYEDMTVAEINDAVSGWRRPNIEAALEYEREHGKRKGAIAALEHALAAKEEH
jgi:large subunit ribosomal protein L21